MFSQAQAVELIGKTILITYRDKEGNQTTRYVIVNIPRESHFVAWCCKANAWRSFRYDSVEDIETNCQQFSLPAK